MMNPAQKLMMQKKPIIPPNLKQNVLAWWDARERGQVWYGLNQSCINGDFESDLTGWTATGNVVASTEHSLFGTTSMKSTPVNDNGYVSQDYIFEIGDVWYYKASVFVESYISGNLFFQVNQGSLTFDTTKLNQWQTKSAIHKIVDISAPYQKCHIGSIASASCVAYFDGFMAYNLTAIFGAGNEPTATEMDAILTADGTAYWEGTKQVLCNPDNKYYWKDYSGNGRHMKLNNFAYSGASGWQSPYGLGTDGVDDYGVRNAAINPANTSFSFLTLFSIPNITGTKVLSYYDPSTSLDGFRIYVLDNTLYINAFDSSGDASNVSASTIISAFKKYMVVCTYDHTDKKARLYLNGNLIVTTNALTNGLIQLNQHRLGVNRILTSYSAQIYYINADFNKTLSPTEVKQLYGNNRRRFGL